MPRQRFLAIWLGFALLYLGLAAAGPDGLLVTGAWPQINQHVLQVRAWRGEDIAVPATELAPQHTVEVSRRLDVTPYFATWVLDDPRERNLLANLACGVKKPGAGRRLEPVQYVAPDTIVGRLQLEHMECHIGSPLGPAFLILPLRMLLGSLVVAQWLGALLGGLAVATMDLIFAWWLEAVRGDGTIPPGERTRLVVLAGLGTLWIWLVPLAGVWFFAQTVATTALVVALALAWRRHWLLAGLAFALAFTSRPPTALALPLLLAILLRQAGPAARLHGTGRGSRRRALAFASLFPIAVGSVHLVLNELRFGSSFEFGYRLMLTPPELRERLAAWGPFHPEYLTTNIRALFLQPPVAATDASGSWVFPYLVSDPHGMGILFVTPAFVGVLLSLGRRWRSQGLLAACWISLALITVPSLLYFNTGWVQWGGRYLLDAWPMWLMLAALGLGRINRRLALGLVVLSVVSNVWATVLSLGGWWP